MSLFRTDGALFPLSSIWSKSFGIVSSALAAWRRRGNTAQTLPDGMRYRAFLSYRSSDRTIAERLHRTLEAYRVPAELVGKLGKRGPIPPRLGRIFRDREELRTAEDIETIIGQELSSSVDLIVLCTPAAADPKAWVGREIELFRSRRPTGRVLAVIGSGEPPHCFPSQLLKWSPDGRYEQPLAADLRRQGDGFARSVVRLVAGLLEINFDDLWQRERRRRRRRLALLGMSVLVLSTALLAAVNDWLRAERSSSYLALANEAQVRSRWDLSALAAAAALRQEAASVAFRSSQGAERLDWLRGGGRTASLLQGHSRSPVLGAVANSYVITAGLDGRVLQWPLGSTQSRSDAPEELHRFVGPVRHLFVSPSGNQVLAASEAGSLLYYEPRSGTRRVSKSAIGSACSAGELAGGGDTDEMLESVRSPSPTIGGLTRKRFGLNDPRRRQR